MSSYRIQFQQGISLPEFLDRFGPGTNVLSDGLGWFSGVIDADCAHTQIVVGARKRREIRRACAL